MLEGSVHRSAERLVVSAALIDVESGRTQWSERFEQPHLDGAALQDAIARRVAVSLPTTGDGDPGLQSYRPRVSEAYFLQLQARAHLKPFTRLPLLKALTLFEQALVLDPDYAMAHAGLASAYLLMASTAMLRPLPVDEAMPMARRSAERAQLDDRLAEAWAALGRVKIEYDWDWDGAEADLAHAVALNPSSVEALGTYGQFLSQMGRHDEAIEAWIRHGVEQHRDRLLDGGPGRPRAGGREREPRGRPRPVARPLRSHDDPRPTGPTRRISSASRRGASATAQDSLEQEAIACSQGGDGGLDLPARAHEPLGGSGDAMDGGRRAGAGDGRPRALHQGAHDLSRLHRITFQSLHGNPRFQGILRALKLEGRGAVRQAA